MPNLPLSLKEAADYHRLLNTAKRILPQFVEFTSIIVQIRERRLYRRDYDTFEDFCRKEFGFTSRRALQLVNATTVVQQLPEETRTDVPNEAAARELSKVPEEKRVEVVNEAKKNGPVTAPAIKAAAAKVLPPEAAAIAAAAKPALEKILAPKDETGHEIPNECRPAWDRRQEVQDMMTAISRIKCQIEKARESDDPLYRRLGPSTLSELAMAHEAISQIKPYAVCTKCQGHPSATSGCSLCYGNGVISKRIYDMERDDIKELRTKAMELRRANA